MPKTPNQPVAARPPTPRPLVVSCLLGAVGVVLLVIGGLSGAEYLSVAGFAAGSLSLAAALLWRSELIAAHRAAKRSLPSK